MKSMDNKTKGKIKTKKQSPKTEAAQNSASQKRSGASSGNGFYYSFLTVVLLLCLFQITVSAVLNVSKIISYKAKIVQITKSRDAAMATNEQLKDSIKNFSNVQGLEAIARNNLKMSGEDEVLVIINSNQQEGKDLKQKSWFDWIQKKSN